MCRLAWQLLGMLGNVLDLLGMLRNVLGMRCNVLGMETWWYTTLLTSQLIRQQVGEFFFDVGLLGPCKKACRGGRGRCKACLGRCEACRGHCQACLGVAKQAYTS